jgi:hypothetical protein
MSKLNHPPKSNSPRRISVDDLHKFVDSLPPEVRESDGDRTIILANTINAHFLGRKWCETHLKHDAPKPSFLRMDFSSDSRKKVIVFRVVELAENLYNLRHIEGFDACIAQMNAGAEKIESTCAELDFGRLLYINDVEFRFIVAGLRNRKNYDFEILYPGALKVPAEAKCKFESTKINPESVRNALKKARTQLPKDRPGLIFVKVPQNWIDNIEVVKALETIAIDFFRNTDRVVSIKFYVSHLELTNQGVTRLERSQITIAGFTTEEIGTYSQSLEHREAGTACHPNGKGYGYSLIRNEQRPGAEKFA